MKIYKRYFRIVITVILIILITAVIVITVMRKQANNQYKAARSLLARGYYADAAAAFAKAKNYQDAEAYAAYCSALAQGTEGNYSDAIKELNTINSFSDSAMRIEYFTARELEENVSDSESITEAIAIYQSLGDFLDCSERIQLLEDEIRKEEFSIADAENVNSVQPSVKEAKNIEDSTIICSVAPTEYPSWLPTETPTVIATQVPTETPTVVPTQASTDAPTIVPTQVPTEIPTVVPTQSPTETPTVVPTQVPTETPTVVPTQAPTETPTVVPTQAPTETPTVVPTPVPTETPTVVPTQVPTETPTVVPTQVPTETPTVVPTQVPTETPTVVPTQSPTETSTIIPTQAPTTIITITPTANPTKIPSPLQTEKAITKSINGTVVDYPLVNIHREASVESQVLGGVYMNDTIQIENIHNGWAKITTADGTEGYVSANFLNYDPRELENAPNAITAVVNADPYLYLRAEPRSDSEVIRTLDNKTIVLIVEKTNNGWARIYYNGYRGYVNQSYLTEK